MKYIFSDKTGTLTCNNMEFKKLCVNGISYGEKRDLKNSYKQRYNIMDKISNVDFMDQSFFEELIENKNSDIKKALIFCAVCHTIICEKNDKGLYY